MCLLHLTKQRFAPNSLTKITFLPIGTITEQLRKTTLDLLLVFLSKSKSNFKWWVRSKLAFNKVTMNILTIVFCSLTLTVLNAEGYWLKRNQALDHQDQIRSPWIKTLIAKQIFNPRLRSSKIVSPLKLAPSFDIKHNLVSPSWKCLWLIVKLNWKELRTLIKPSF